MFRRAALVLFLLLASGAQAQLADVNETLPEDDVLDEVLAPVEGIGEGIGEAGAELGEGIGEAFSAIGDAMQAIGRAVVAGLEGAYDGTAAFGGVLAGAVATGTLALLKGSGTAAGGLGAGSIDGVAYLGIGVGQGIAWLAVGIGHGATALVGGIWSGLVGTVRLVGLLQPATMPAPVFWSIAATGGTTSAAIGGWAGWEALRRWGLVGAGVAGFSRIQDDALLEHPLRSDIFSTIRENPGIHASQLAREVDAGWGTVTHHLDKLTKARLVTTRRVNNQKCYFEQGGQVGRQDMAIASAVKGDTAGLITQYVLHNPMTSQKQMAEAIGISPALASFHVKKLANLGVLEKVRSGKQTLLSTSEALRRLMASEQNPLVAFEAKATGGLEYGS